MNRDVAKMVTLIGGLLFAGLLLIFLLQVQERWLIRNPIVRPRLETKEGFQGGEMPAKVENQEDKIEGLSPGVAGLDKPRAPYTLLSGWLDPKTPQEAAEPGASFNPPGAPTQLPASRYGTVVEDLYSRTGVLPRPAFTAQSCYESDFETRLEKTGNFRQLTNNYKRADPDSCTAPLHDTALGFYKVEPLPAAGCLSPTEWQTVELKSKL